VHRRQRAGLALEGREAPRRFELEGEFAHNEEAAQRAHWYRKVNDALKALYDSVLDEPVPERLLARPRTWRARAGLYAKAASLLAVGVALGWLAHAFVPSSSGQGVTLARQAAVAHAVYAPEVRHPVEVGADDQDHLVRWLSKRLGTELKCPNLSAYGFELVGGRLLAGPNGPVAQFMFQDARGARLTLYVSGQRGDSRETAFRFSQEDRVSVFYWVDGNFGYALSGEVRRDQLLRVADDVYKQLNP
jgi:anti-sigma factor RsiW